jgi:hypothetical protein
MENQPKEAKIRHIQFKPIHEKVITLALISCSIVYSFNGVIKEGGKTLIDFEIKTDNQSFLRTLPIECIY